MLPILEGKPDGEGINSLSLAEVSCVSAATPLSWVSAAAVTEAARAESAVLLSGTRSLLAAYSSSICVVVLRRACRHKKQTNKLPLQHARVCAKSPALELISWQLASSSNIGNRLWKLNQEAHLCFWAMVSQEAIQIQWHETLIWQLVSKATLSTSCLSILHEYSITHLQFIQMKCYKAERNKAKCKFK